MSHSSINNVRAALILLTLVSASALAQAGNPPKKKIGPDNYFASASVTATERRNLASGLGLSALNKTKVDQMKFQAVPDLKRHQLGALPDVGYPYFEPEPRRIPRPVVNPWIYYNGKSGGGTGGLGGMPGSVGGGSGGLSGLGGGSPEPTEHVYCHPGQGKSCPI